MRPGTQKKPQVKKELCRVLDYVQKQKKKYCSKKTTVAIIFVTKMIFIINVCFWFVSRRDLLKASISRKLESLYLWVNKISLTAHKSLAIMAVVEDGWTMHSATLRPTMELTQKLLILILVLWVKKRNQYNFFLATAGQTVNAITICWQIVSWQPLETLSSIKNPKNKLLL